MSERKEKGTRSGTPHDQPAMKKRCRCDREESTVEEKGPMTEKDDEVHILTERERRKKMRTMFNDLHALLPHLPSKADKSSIVDETMRYIGNLQEELKKLQRQKEERASSHGSTDLAHESSSIVSFDQVQGKSNETYFTSSPNDLPVSYSTWTSPSVTLNIVGDCAQMSICVIPKPRLFSTICYVMEKHGINVVSAHVSSDSNLRHYMIQMQVMNGGTDEDDHRQQQHHHQWLKTEEVYKQAAHEIILWISSL